MLKKEHQVLGPLIAEPWKRFTFKEIQESSKKTSKSYVFTILKALVNENIIQEEKIGNLLLYQWDHKSLKAQVYAGVVSEHLAWHKPWLPYDTLQKAAAKVPTPFYTLLVTGSYARKTQKTASDIDVVLIIDDAADTKRVYAQLRSACEMSIPEIHLYVFKKAEFLEMLINKEANYGKEIVQNTLLLYGAEGYYSILSEALERGFTDQSLS
ncbi:nucleotidyltransferase domain-containing protein [Candidatus Woesearchaeota archaeon]|nr:nucleotidyltransferase domain-containing protein [Candidatus Woesearchaeota archaeon]